MRVDGERLAEGGVGTAVDDDDGGQRTSGPCGGQESSVELPPVRRGHDEPLDRHVGGDAVGERQQRPLTLLGVT